jgi:predicted RNase H-like HicB family nuclease
VQAFRYRITVMWSDDEQAYVARVPAIAGCSATGVSPHQAVREVVDAAESILEIMREDGDRLPAEDVPGPRK